MVTARLLATKDSTYSQFGKPESLSFFYDHTGGPSIDSALSEEDLRPDQLEDGSDSDRQGGDELMFVSEGNVDTERFERLKTEWEEASAHMSSTTDIAMLPSYQQIIGMGEIAVPLILRELEKEPAHWFWALKSITGESPIPLESRGRVREMAEAWIGWGRQNGYQW